MMKSSIHTPALSRSHKIRGYRMSVKMVAPLMILLVIATFGCASRLKLRLNCQTPSGSVETKVNDAFYVLNHGVSDALQKDFIIPADGALAALAIAIPDTSYATIDIQSGLPIAARPTLNMRIYWPLPKELNAGQKGKHYGAFVDLVGNYEATQAERILQLAHGDLVIDSVKSKKLYVSIAATFRSLAGDSLRFDGAARLSVRDRVKFKNTSYQLNDR